MADPDYYKVLGVSKKATPEEIRKAYRKLARENHPDAKPNDTSAADRFKSIQEAYDVLNDEKKRQHYDRFGTSVPFGATQGGAGANPFGGAGGFRSGPIDFGDLFGQGVDFSEFFSGGGPTGERRGKRAPSKGEDVQVTLTIPFKTAVTGGSVDVRLDRNGKIETLGVKVPSGVNSGQVIRLSGQGNPSARGGAAGDLYLTIQIESHPYFRREGSNLLIDVSITPSEAVLGTKVDVPTLAEGPVVVTIPPGTSSGAKLRLRGKGVTDSQTHQTGDQFVVVKIVVPRELSDKDKSLYKQLAENEASPRDNLW
ncbi:MAG: J domain-containing protein [Planctomycetes bacterium]|nr:J domain-containing protein [Planctomycetota bacterium]